eukprot:888475-Prymnesium_polylepis.2
MSARVRANGCSLIEGQLGLFSPPPVMCVIHSPSAAADSGAIAPTQTSSGLPDAAHSQPRRPFRDAIARVDALAGEHHRYGGGTARAHCAGPHRVRSQRDRRRQVQPKAADDVRQHGSSRSCRQQSGRPAPRRRLRPR